MLRNILNTYPFMTPRARILRRLPPVPSDGRPFRSHNGMIVGYFCGRDYVSSSLYWFGNFDPWVDETLRRLAHSGEVALDIGANIGSTTLVLARAVGPRGKVVAFEPHPGNVSLLRANLSSNSLTMVEVEPIAISNKDASMYLTEPAGQPGMARITTPDEDTGEIAIPARSLDGWLESRPDLGSIAVCKIDVEGHEESVFMGMPENLQSGRIASFLFERHLPAPAPSDTLIDYLSANHYQVYRIEKSPLKVVYTEPSKRPRLFPTSDYVAVRKNGNAAIRLGL